MSDDVRVVADRLLNEAELHIDQYGHPRVHGLAADILIVARYALNAQAERAALNVELQIARDALFEISIRSLSPHNAEEAKRALEQMARNALTPTRPGDVGAEGT